MGPNQPYSIASDYGFTVDPGNYTFSGISYFELHQGDTVIQSVLEKPQVGESEGKYWIRDLPMKGSWTVAYWPATLYSLDTHTIQVTPDLISKIPNSVLGVFLTVLFLFCSLVIIVWLDNLL